MKDKLSKLIGEVTYSDWGWSENERLAHVMLVTTQKLNLLFVDRAITAEQYLNEIRDIFQNSKL